MTAAEFIAALPGDPALALAELEGALAYDGIGANLSPEDRALIVRERLERQRRAR